MRCWTNESTHVFWQGRELTVVGAEKRRSFAIPLEAHDYTGPKNALAVAPDGTVAWIGDEGSCAYRVDLRTGEHRQFDFVLADATYVSDDELLAVVRDKPYGPGRLQRFRDADSITRSDVPRPAARAIAWPYGAPYQFAAFDDDESSSCRITTTAFGVCVAWTSGLIVAFPANADPFAYRIAPVYQGWIVAALDHRGLVSCAMHNGRAGEIVWVGPDGVWEDAFPSDWYHDLSPCMPVSDGWMVSRGDRDEASLVLLRGYLRRPVARDAQDSGAVDVAVDVRGTTLVWIGQGAGVARLHDGRWRLQPVALSGQQATPAARSLQPPDVVSDDIEPWRFERIRDDALGELAPVVPDRGRMATCISLAHAADEGDEDAGEELARQLPWYPLQRAEDMPAQVFRSLRRFPSTSHLTREQLEALIVRLRHESDPFLRWHATQLMPEGCEQPPQQLEAAAAVRWYLAHMTDARLTFGDGPNKTTKIIHGARLRGSIRGTKVQWDVHVEHDAGTLSFQLSRIPQRGLVAGDDEGQGLRVKGIESSGRLAEAPLELEQVELSKLPIAGHQLDCTGRTSDGDKMMCMSGVDFEGLTVPAASAQEAMLFASRHLEIDGLFVRRSADGWLVTASRAADGASEPCTRPPVLPVARELIDALVAHEAIELARDVDDVLLRAVQYAMFGAWTPAGRARQLEALLLEHRAVAEVFADTDTLAARLMTVLDS